MIYAKETRQELEKLLQTAQPDSVLLSDPSRVGFDPESEFAGRARRTFSLILAKEDVLFLENQLQTLYQQIKNDIGDQSKLPFDAIRLDCFYDTTTHTFKILEINSRSVSMNEFTEWLDGQIGDSINAAASFSLNEQLVKNQYAIHRQVFSQGVPTLYISKRPSNWIYMDYLTKQYRDLTVTTDIDAMRVVPDGLEFNGQIYQSIIKQGVDMPEGAWELDEEGQIKVLQSRTMRSIGEKDYLASLDLPSVARSRKISSQYRQEYIDNQKTLVLKQVDSSGARGVVVGPEHSELTWKKTVNTALKNPNEWIVQDFVSPPSVKIVEHGGVVRDAKVQLGVFLLPDPSSVKGVVIDVYARAYTGTKPYFMFDPASHIYDIWFGNVVISDS